MSNATIIFERENGYEAVYSYGKLPKGVVERLQQSPNLGYRFEEHFQHFLFYKDNYGYDDVGDQYKRSELAGIEEGHFGLQQAKGKCLDLLLQDRDLLYKNVLLVEKGSSEPQKVTRDHAGRVE